MSLQDYNRNRQIQSAAGNLTPKQFVKALGGVNRAAQLRLKAAQGTISTDETYELNELEAANNSTRHRYEEKVRKEKALKDKRAKEWAAKKARENQPPDHTLASQIKKLLSLS